MIMEKLENPQKDLKVIHIAGTNGKGSVAVMSETILKTHGYKTGLFISPYVIDFRERIQINGEMISEENFCKYFSIVKNAFDSIEDNEFTLSQFEFITAIAFIYFKEMECDYVVLETGLGGRYDATNIIEKPLCTVITSISFDHTSILGNTIEEIALEKAGIIKKDVPLITCLQENSVMDILKSTCEEIGSSITILNPKDAGNISVNLSGTSYIYKGEKYCTNLVGTHQVENSLLSVFAIKSTLGIDVNCISGVSHPCRLEVVKKSPLIIIDGAHNPSAAKSLKEFLLVNGFLGTLIFGSMKDKDYEKVLEELSPVCKKLIAVEIPNPRAAKSEDIVATAKQYINECIIAKNYKEALLLSANDNILICGSLFLASDIRKLIIS